MRLWGVCVQSMEKQITNLSSLVNYRNRQVILNYYDKEDFLYKRDGFHFTVIHLSAQYLSFIKANGSNYTISFSEFPTAWMNDDFQNFFILRNGTERLEIYFP